MFHVKHLGLTYLLAVVLTCPYSSIGNLDCGIIERMYEGLEPLFPVAPFHEYYDYYDRLDENRE